MATAVQCIKTQSYALREEKQRLCIYYESRGPSRQNGGNNRRKFSTHVAKAANKGNQVIGAIRCSFRYMDKDMLTQLYKALVRGHLEYGNTVWNPINKGDQDQLEKVQHRATKLETEIYPTRTGYGH